MSRPELPPAEVTRAYEPAHSEEIKPHIENPPFADLYHKRAKQGGDLVTVVTDNKNRRNTGKTVLALLGAHYCDRTAEGITKEKATVEPEIIIDAYLDQPKGSGLLLDEAEASASKYRAGSAVNKALRELVNMGRVEEKYLWMTAPNWGELDNDLKALVDVWISIEERGRAKVHILDFNEYRGQLLTPLDERLYWDDIPTKTPLRRVYHSLRRQKRKRLRNRGGANLVKESEVQDRIQKANKKAKREQRDEIIKALVNDVGLRPSDIEGGFKITPQRIGQIAREG